jgi:hypothetical protein
MCISVKMHYILWEVGSPHHLNKSDLAVQRLSPQSQEEGFRTPTRLFLPYS